MDQIINHAVLSLDFWQDTVTYEGSTMPTGTIGCEVLNIPDSTIEKLDTPCNVLNQLLQGMNTGSVDMKLLPQVQQDLLSVRAAPQQNGKHGGIGTELLRSCHTTAPLPDVHPLHGGAEPCGAVQREHGALQLAGTVGVAVAPRQAA